jgi:alkanesulfonate monooxygenase SsuD/methylene tetrahydromethanopterin reductase-like flavin-dependent oxidoreductase (luciferase family)
MLSVMAICADTDERAAELALPAGVLVTQFAKRQPAALLPVPEAAEYQLTDEEVERLRARQSSQAVGSPGTVRQRLSSLAATAVPDELMLLTPVYDIDDRFRSLDLIIGHATDEE